MKKVFSLFMALCVMLSLALPAFATDTPTLTVATAGISIKENTETVSPMSVARGSRITPTRTTVFPAYIDTDTNQIMYSSKVYRTVYTPTAINSTLYLTPTQTASLIAEFKGIIPADKDQDLWIVQSTFHIENDGSGSYGKYIKFKPDGNFAGKLDSDGTVTYDLPRSTAMSYTIDLNTFFYTNPNSTVRYNIGFTNGGYYYYNALTRQEMSQMVGSGVCLNHT